MTETYEYSKVLSVLSNQKPLCSKVLAGQDFFDSMGIPSTLVRTISQENIREVADAHGVSDAEALAMIAEERI